MDRRQRLRILAVFIRRLTDDVDFSTCGSWWVFHNAEVYRVLRGIICTFLSTGSVALSQVYYTNNGFVYTLASNQATVVNYVGSGGEVSIPQTLGTSNPVIAIGDSAFQRKASVTSATIPLGVASIGDSAFGDSTNLAWIVIPDSVTTIGSAAFQNCVKLTNVVIPNSVTNIGFQCFFGNTSLAAVALPAGLTNIPRALFQFCTALTNVAIPPGVLSIEELAFGDCKFTSLVIPLGVTNIGKEAFNKSAIATVSIPDSVKQLGDYVFGNCSNLNTAIIGHGVTNVPYATFAFCKSLNSVTLGNGVTTLGGYSFYNCTGLTSLILPSALSTIEGDPLFGCTNLISVLFRGNAPIVGQTGLKFPSNSLVYYLPGSSGWQPTFAGRPVQSFVPIAVSPAMNVSTGFRFFWTGTGLIPMNVQRSTLLSAPWVVVSPSNQSGSFTDTLPPAGQAFYRVVLP